MQDNKAPDSGKDKSGNIGCIILVIIIAVFIIAALINNQSSNSSTSYSNTSNLSSGNYSYSSGNSDKTDVWACAKKAVTDVLKSPSSAEFCSYSSATITSLGSNEYKIVGYVDAQNSFGATLRKNFTVTLTMTSQGFKDNSVEFE